MRKLLASKTEIIRRLECEIALLRMALVAARQDQRPVLYVTTDGRPIGVELVVSA